MLEEVDPIVESPGVVNHVREARGLRVIREKLRPRAWGVDRLDAREERARGGEGVRGRYGGAAEGDEADGTSASHLRAQRPAPPILGATTIREATHVLGGGDDIFGEWREFVRQEKEKEIDAIIVEEKLKADETKKFIDNAFRDGELKTTGVGIDSLLPPMRRFGGNSNRAEKKQTVIEKLKAFFEKFFGIV